MDEKNRKKIPCSVCGVQPVGRHIKFCLDCREVLYWVTINCVVCEKVFRRHKSEAKKAKQHTCSMFCRNKLISIRQTGEGSWFWKGGLTSQDKKLRNSVKYKQWREMVFGRDNYTCQICLVHSSKLPKSSLTADHIKPWALYPELRFDLNNGRTLCLPCHRNTDTWGYKMYALIKKENA